MALALDAETRLALVKEIKRLIPSGEQKRIAYAIADALGTERSTEVPRLSRLLKPDVDTIEQMLGPERAEKVLGAICSELKIEVAGLVRVARRTARPQPRPAPDRHPAWQELGEDAPWVECVPGLPDGTESLRRAIESGFDRRVIWLVGPPGSGKSARLWRAQQQEIGQIVTGRIPDKAEPGAVWLVDEPDDPDAWIAGAKRCQARLVIATRTASRSGTWQAPLELAPWTHLAVESFLDQLAGVRGHGVEALETIDLDLVADRLAALASAWTPLDLGNVIRLFVDEPTLLDRDTNDRELRIRSALNQLLRRAELSPAQEKLWCTHGRRALALAAATALQGADIERLVAPVGEPVLREALAAVAGTMVGGSDGEPLRVIIERVRKESGKDGKKAFQLLESLAQAPSSDELLELLVATGAWRRTDNAMLVPADEALALTLAAEHLGDDWMWGRLRDTLADIGWSAARMEWAARLGRVQERLDELLATGPAVHVGAVELAVALVAFAPELARPEQATRAVFSAVRLLECPSLERLGLGPRHERLREALRTASRRYRRSLPPVTITLTTDELAERCTESTRRVIGATESLVDGRRECAPGCAPGWVLGLILEVPAWFFRAVLLPWQALSVLQDPRGWSPPPFMRVDWEPVIMDYAADGHRWARAVATGDVEDIRQTAMLVSSRGLLRALERWPTPGDPKRHEWALRTMLRGLPASRATPRSRLHTRAVKLIADLYRRHPEHPLPNMKWMGELEHLLPDVLWRLSHDEQDCWREALEQAAAVHHLESWFEGEQRALAQAMDYEDRMARFSGMARPLKLPSSVAESIVHLLRLGESLHLHSHRAPLLGLFEQIEPRPHHDRTSAAWELQVGAADALLRLRDAESLRSLRERHRTAGNDAVSSVLARRHDEETLLWIADNLGERFDEVLANIASRPEWREAAQRWALDPSRRWQRQAAARWLIEHPAAGESAHVRWLFTDLPVAVSGSYAQAGLAHPDDAVRRAAAALLERALDELGADPDLVAVARWFVAFPGDPEQEDEAAHSLSVLCSYLDCVNDSKHCCSSSSIRVLIHSLQRHLAATPDEDLWMLHGLCSALGAAARRVQPDCLAVWLREPLGDHVATTVTPSRLAEVRESIARGILHSLEDGANLDGEVLQVLADATDMSAHQAWWLLLKRDLPTDEQLMAEWADASDEVIVGDASGTARWQAIQGLLRHRDPHGYARALTDRLLALPPHLRRSGIFQISQVAMLDARQAERLSPLFD